MSRVISKSISLTPSFTCTHLRFLPFRTSSSTSPSPTQFRRMAAAEPSSSSASSAIDFLTLCHRLKRAQEWLPGSLFLLKPNKCIIWINDLCVVGGLAGAFFMTTKREGWVRRNVENPESIADHMHRMGLMALISTDIPGINREKCIKMAIVHDIAEAIVGDITPADGIPKHEKNRREREALEHMCKLLGGGPRAKEIADLWMEYEENSTPEAKIVKDFDKAEMILQALEYENEQGKDLEEFFESTAGKFQTELGKAWASEIASRRRK